MDAGGVPVRRWAGRVLIVEDEIDTGVRLKDIIEASLPGVASDLAPSGAHALRLLGHNAYDIIITDQTMPGMTGLEFLQAARAVAPRAARMLMADSPDVDVAIRGINEYHIENFILKPLDAADVAEKIERVLTTRRRIRQQHREHARAFDHFASRRAAGES